MFFENPRFRHFFKVKMQMTDLTFQGFLQSIVEGAMAELINECIDFLEEKNLSDELQTIDIYSAPKYNGTLAHSMENFENLNDYFVHLPAKYPELESRTKDKLNAYYADLFAIFFDKLSEQEQLEVVQMQTEAATEQNSMLDKLQEKLKNSDV